MSCTIHSEIKMSASDRQVLRKLAGRAAELAAREEEQEKQTLWRKHNALEAVRPLVFCDPENGWNEIIPSESLECQGEIAREWEIYLRKEIFWGEKMRDDRVIIPHFKVRHIASESGWGVDIRRIGGSSGGSYIVDAPIKTPDDISRLKFPEITVDWDATNQLLELADNVFGDLMPVKLHTDWWWTLGLTYELMHLRGLEQMMIDMVEAPDNIHKMMRILRDGTIAKLDYLETNGLLCLNNDGDYVGSGGFGWSNELPQPDFSGQVRTIDMWGFAESQETVSVSPTMFEEFVFQYQLPILSRFGLNCYGCCEPLDTRIHIIKRIPRLRRVSVSPWSNVETMAEALGDKYIFSMKPNPADLAAPTFDENRIREGLRRALEKTRGCRVEIIMKDCHTINHDPNRVIIWTQIALEEAERIC